MATSFYAPDPVQSTFLIPGTNTPGTGVQVFFYVAGSSTKETVYQDEAGNTAHTNPIVLDSGGNLPGTGSVWFTAGVNYDVVYAPSNDTDPPVSPYKTLQDLSGINDVSAQTGVQWVTGPAPTFVGTTRLTVAGDQTATLHNGRRIQTTNTGGTIYSTITSSVFATTTALGVTNDSGVLDSGLSALQYGLLSATNPSIPVISDAYPSRSASSDATKLFRVNVNPIPSSTTVVETMPGYSFTAGVQNRASDIAASSGTLNFSSASGNFANITGTTGVSAITMFDGQDFVARFTSTVTLSNSTSLVMMTGANVSTRNGDVFGFKGSSSGAAINTFGPPQANQGASRVFLASLTANNTSQLNFASSVDWTNYHRLEFEVAQIIPAGTSASFGFAISTSDGTNYVSTGGAYKYAATGVDSAGNTLLTTSETGNVVQCTQNLNVAATSQAYSWNGVIGIMGASSVAHKFWDYELTYYDTNNSVVKQVGGASLIGNTAAQNGISFRLTNSVNMSSGAIFAFGIRNA